MKSRNRGLRVALTVSALLGPLAPALALAPSADAAAKAPGCSTVSPADIKVTLGLKVGGPTMRSGSAASGYGFDCNYAVPNTGGVEGVTIHYNHSDRAKFAKEEKSSSVGTNNVISGIGDVAFANTVGSGQYAMVSFHVLKGANEFIIEAQVALSKDEALARMIVSRI